MSLRKSARPTNPYGDVQLDDPKAMRALAHPVRLAILGRLQRHGPSTASRLSPDVGATPSVTSWHLRHLAAFGLVRDSDAGEDGRERWWEAVGRGHRFVAPDDPEQAVAYRALAEQHYLYADGQRRGWIDEVEPGLPLRWRKLSGLANTRVVVTASELERIDQAIEELLAPFVLREEDEAPRGSRGVRLMRYAMPEADPDPPAVTS
jgi:DNA-binding transcriptional ArsR family regulator